jgi:mannose-6-phosphate isomerase-like protein (cupin superfamily)
MPNQIAGSAAMPIIREAGTGPTHDVLGVTHTYKALASETGGRISIWESVVPPGAGAPHHSHTAEDEAFYVVEGEATIEIEGQPQPLVIGAGGFVYSPRGEAHSFRNAGGGVLRMLVMCLPGGLERMFGEIGDATRGVRAPDPARIGAITAAHGVSITGPS